MSEIKKVGNKIRYSVDVFDGGLNTNDAPSKIRPNESPDLLNVVFDEDGAVKTRNGSHHVHDAYIHSITSDSTSYYRILDAASYNDQIILWVATQDFGASTIVSRMYRSQTGAGSGVTNSYAFTQITAACGTVGTNVTEFRAAHTVYQDILFFSDSINCFKYSGDGTTTATLESVYKWGISYDASAPAVATTASGGTQLAANTYYYAVSHENTQVVEGQIGAISAGVVVPASGSVKITGIPTCATIDGINKKYIYRGESSSGPFRRLTSIWDIDASASGVTESIAPAMTQVFDNTPVGQEGRLAILDAEEPPPFTTADVHKERIFINDISATPPGTGNYDYPSTLRWSEFTNPFVFGSLNFDTINNGDGEFIAKIISQDDVLTVFKQSKGWGILCEDPSDQLTWARKEHPSNIGIYSPNSAIRYQNGILFLGRSQNKVTGIHFLTGLQIVESYDGKLRSLTVSKKIEPTLFDVLPDATRISSFSSQATYLNVSMAEFGNKAFLTYTPDRRATASNCIWFDLNRLNLSDPNGIGSWSLLKFPTDALKLFSHDGGLYSVDQDDCELDSGVMPTGYSAPEGVGGWIRKIDLADYYSDSGKAIDSYFYTKEFGGSESAIESYYKDLRDVYLWHENLGDYAFNFHIRRDGDTGVGQRYTMDMSGDTTSAWGTAVWGSSTWGDSLVTSTTKRLSAGGLLGRRFQFRFDNQDTAGQGFHVNRLEMDLNIRRRR